MNNVNYTLGLDKIGCCYLMKVINRVIELNAYNPSATKGMVETGLVDEEGAKLRQGYLAVGAENALLILLSILKVDEMLCNECSKFRDGIAEPSLRRMVDNFMERESKKKWD